MFSWSTSVFIPFSETHATDNLAGFYDDNDDIVLCFSKQTNK